MSVLGVTFESGMDNPKTFFGPIALTAKTAAKEESIPQLIQSTIPSEFLS